METKIKWNEGDGYITATYEGSGSGSASISSDVNEGIDREQSIKVETTDKSVLATLVVSQEGLREVFTPSDGDFILADGGTFNVLKGEEGEVSLISFTIDLTQYQAEEGMTWWEWVNSQYNTDGYRIDFDDSIKTQSGGFWIGTSEDYVFSQDIIIEGYQYALVG